jgi:hypothetical protein
MLQGFRVHGNNLYRTNLICNDFYVKWLGREDSNLRMAESKSAALPLGDAPSTLTNAAEL